MLHEAPSGSACFVRGRPAVKAGDLGAKFWAVGFFAEQQFKTSRLEKPKLTSYSRTLIALFEDCFAKHLQANPPGCRDSSPPELEQCLWISRFLPITSGSRCPKLRRTRPKSKAMCFVWGFPLNQRNGWLKRQEDSLKCLKMATTPRNTVKCILNWEWNYSTSTDNW